MIGRELIIDNFAGGGGASTGIEMAIGRSVDIAINHDPAAIAMHRANHPRTLHYCESVWDVDPREIAKGMPVGLCWLSPDCKHFSKAKGGKPVEKHIRGLAWVAIRWAATVRPRVIILENVEEFKTWGPLLKDGKPDPKQKGRTFNCFVNALKRQGYKVDYRELRACDFGAPTIRKRFFLIARCDGRPIVWPEPTYGDPKSPEVKSGKLKPWRTAAEIIDWSLPCPSIFERERPLAENTLRRIAKGIQKFVIDNPNPFIIKVNHEGEDFRGQAIDEPMQTITAKNGWGIVTPFFAGAGGPEYMGKPTPADEPMRTVITENHRALVAPILAGVGGRAGQSRPRSGDEPLATITAKADTALITPIMVRDFGCSIGHGVDNPLGTVTAGGGGKSKLVAAFISKYHGAKTPDDARGSVLEEPIRTVDTSNRFSVCAAFISKYYAGNYTGAGDDLNNPLPTVTSKDHNALVTSHLIKMRGTNIGSPMTEPVHTVTAGGLHIGEVRAFLMKYYGTSIGQNPGEPLHTVTSKDTFGLVTIHGENYQIVDIGMRMLEPYELFAAQGFPRGYIINQDHEGRKYSKAAQVARCGNSVPPDLAKALTLANVPELCMKKGSQSRFDEEQVYQAGLF